MPNSVLTIAPLRISYVGGGSDIASFYSLNEGAVVSTAIQKYVFVHAKIHDDSFGERYRISYSQVEHVQQISEIKNEIVRNCLEFMDISEPIQISTSSDLPAGSGLGSSSSFTVALLLALHELKGQHPTKHQLAEEACHVEIEMLGHPIGKQDQYAAAFGGLNLFRFETNDRVVVEPICISSSQSTEFLGRCRLYWTKVGRSATKILTDQASRLSVNLEKMKVMVELAHEFKDSLEQETINWKFISQLINQSWDLKQTFSPLISAGIVGSMIQAIRLEDNFGTKLLGAGGGGFVLAFDGSENRTNLDLPRIEMSTSSFVPSADYYGARVISLF